jgi:uncharacterized protein
MAEKGGKFYSLLLSPNMEMTPERYLICRNVPICRSGTQEYYGRELVGFPGYEESWGLEPETKYPVLRPPEEVLHPDTIRSFEGKSVVDTHPDTEGNVIDIDNERDLGCGHVQDISRGPDQEGDVTLKAGALIIKDPDLVNKVRPDDDPESGVRDISCGYTLRLGRKKNGTLYMHHIRGNHVAVVEKGRAGPRIAIRDTAPPELNRKDNRMSLFTRIRARGLKAAVADASPEELDELASKIGENGHVVTITKVEEPPRAAADAAPKAVEKSKEQLAKDADPHRMAAHSCLDRMLDAMSKPDAMGCDAMGKPCSMDALHDEMSHFIGKKKPAEDAEEKAEELKEPKVEKDAADEEEEQEEKTAAEEKEEMHAGDAGAHAEKEIDDPGESVLKAANDSLRQFIKSSKPIVAAYLNKPKSSRTAQEQAMIDSYQDAVRQVNQAQEKGLSYGVLVKVKTPKKMETIASDSAPASAEPCTCFDGVPFKVGQKKHEEHLQRMQKGNK